MHSFRARGALLALSALVVLGGCGSDAAPSEQRTSDDGGAAVAVDPTPATPEPTPSADVAPPEAWIAAADAEEVEVFATADAAEPEGLIRAADVVSVPGQVPLTFLVAAERDDRVQVHLPVRPSGTTGWVRTSDVELTSTDFRVEVRLEDHRLLLHRGEEVVMDVPVGLGRADLPTPGGVYYIKELLRPPEPGGAYGAYAYGLSGYSPVLESFAGGDGVIGIHGTNDPDSVGTDASHGCIRMHDADVTRLAEEFGLPLGTPVEVIA